VATTLFLGVLFVAVFPTRTMLKQRADTNAAAAELDELAAERAALRKKVAQQNDPKTVEQRAREQGWVRPGEESYSVLPAPVPPIGLPSLWPFAGVEQLLSSQP
jgi:cell division protein FtsB